MRRFFNVQANKAPALVALIYAVFGFVWIFFSDQFLATMVRDPGVLTQIQTLKGIVYLLVTAVLIFLLVRFFIDAHLQTLDELQVREKLYRDFIEETDDLVTRVNAEGRFTFVNAQAREVFGLEPEECLGLSAFDFIHPGDRDETQKRFFAALENKLQSVEFENLQVSRAGKVTRMLWMTNIHYRADGSVESVNGIGHDITRRKQLDEMLLQTEKMASIGGLTAGMAHEINNPMAGILQSSQLLQNRLSPDSARSQKVARETALPLKALQDFLQKQDIPHLLDNIRTEGRRVARIVTDILDFSRKHDLQTKPTDMRELLDQCVELASKEYNLAARFDFRMIEVVRDYPAELPLVDCDRSQMRQVLINLLRNGAHAMLTWPQADRKPTFWLGLQADLNWLEITIHDNGIGMDEEVRKRIFEPFYTTKETGGGTGLGLFVAYSIVVDKHGGSLQVESTEGQGSCFTIRLPRKS